MSGIGFQQIDVPEQAVLHGAIHFSLFVIALVHHSLMILILNPLPAIAPEAMSARLPQKLMSLPRVVF